MLSTPARITQAVQNILTKQLYFAFCGFILVLAFAMRFVGLTSQCLTNDEVIEVEDAKASLTEILYCPDAFPPLYRLSLAAWINTIGSETTTRWFSLLQGLAFVVVLMATAQLIVDQRAALATGFIVAVNPLMVHYAQETRAYMLYLLAAALVLYFFCRCLQTDSRRDWLSFALASIFAAYTHYYSGLLLITLGLIWCVQRLSRRESLKQGLLSIVYIAIGCLPLLSFFAPDLQDTVGYGVKAPPFDPLVGGYTYFSFLGGFCIGPSRTDLREMPGSAAVGFFAPWILLLGSMAGMTVISAVRRLWTTNPIWLWVLFLTSTVPVFLSGGLSMVVDLRYSVRYIVIAAIPILIVLGIGLGSIKKAWLTWLLAAAFLVLGVYAQFVRHTNPKYKNEDLRSTANYLASEVTTGTPTFILSDYIIRPLEHYAGPDANLISLPNPDQWQGHIDDAVGLQEAVRQMRTMAGDQPATIVLSRPFHGDPHRLFRNWLLEEKVELIQQFDGVEIYEFQTSDE